jgi:hypothetical protein
MDVGRFASMMRRAVSPTWKIASMRQASSAGVAARNGRAISSSAAANVNTMSACSAGTWLSRAASSRRKAPSGKPASFSTAGTTALRSTSGVAGSARNAASSIASWRQAMTSPASITASNTVVSRPADAARLALSLMNPTVSRKR